MTSTSCAGVTPYTWRAVSCEPAPCICRRRRSKPSGRMLPRPWLSTWQERLDMRALERRLTKLEHVHRQALSPQQVESGDGSASATINRHRSECSAVVCFDPLTTTPEHALE